MDHGSDPNPKTPKTPTYVGIGTVSTNFMENWSISMISSKSQNSHYLTYVGIGTLVHTTTMVDGRRRPWQPPPPWRNPPARTMAAMEIVGRISQRHYTGPLDQVLGESGSAGFCEKLIFQSTPHDLLHLSCQIIRSCHQRGMVVAMAIDDGFGGCYFTDRF